MTFLALLCLTATNGVAATPESLPPPLLKAVWSETPQGFETVSFETHWRWSYDAHLLLPNAEIVAHLVLRLPKDWEYRSVSAHATRFDSIKKVAGEPGQWTVIASQDVMDGGGAFEFTDGRGEKHRMTVSLRSLNRNPYLLFKTSCPSYDIRLDPRTNTARFLYIAVGCSTFADDLVVTLRRSPDARWFATPELPKTFRSDALEFEDKIPLEKIDATQSAGQPLFTVRAEDGSANRSEWLLWATKR